MKTPIHFYTSLTERDQKAVKLVLLFIPILIYLIVIQPLYNFYDHSRLAFQESQQLLSWMHENQSRVASAGKTPTSILTKADLLETISSVAEKENISIDRLVPQNKGLVRIWFNEVEFSKLLTSLKNLSQKSVKIKTVTINTSIKPGVVSAQLTLTNAD